MLSLYHGTSVCFRVNRLWPSRIYGWKHYFLGVELSISCGII